MQCFIYLIHLVSNPILCSIWMRKFQFKWSYTFGYPVCIGSLVCNFFICFPHIHSQLKLHTRSVFLWWKLFVVYQPNCGWPFQASLLTVRLWIDLSRNLPFITTDLDASPAEVVFESGLLLRLDRSPGVLQSDGELFQTTNLEEDLEA